MPSLSNPKHERFAQALAKGETATAAYVSAGYEPNDGNAARLKGNDRIEARVAEILERAATRAEITVASISDRLLKIAEKCERTSEANKLGVARATLMDVAKLNGLVVDRSKNDTTIRNVDLSGLSDEELEALEAIRSKLAFAGADPEGEGSEGS